MICLFNQQKISRLHAYIFCSGTVFPMLAQVLTPKMLRKFGLNSNVTLPVPPKISIVPIAADD